MDYNKGRFVPDVNPMSLFSEDGARTPFRGEVCLDDETNDIYFWKQNDTTNVWESHCRTKEIQDYLDNYENDKTFPAARAFVSNETIHRMFYNHETQQCWIDDSVSVQEYKYFAIKSITKINGKQRYVTGTKPYDGLTNEFALFPIGEKATTIFPINGNVWYAVEFYDDNLSMRSLINFMTYPVKRMPIEKNLKQNDFKVVDGNIIRGMDGRIIDFAVKFNQSLGENKAYLYMNQPVSALKVSVIKKMSDKHICSTNTNIYAERFEVNNVTDDPITMQYYITNLVKTIDGRTFIGWSLDGKQIASMEQLSCRVIDPNSVDYIFGLFESNEVVENRIKLNGFDRIDVTKLGDYECNVDYSYIKTNGSTKKFKILSNRKTVVDNKDVSVIVDGKDSTRNIISVYVEQIGDAEYETEVEYSINSEEDCDVITIPRSYFGFGGNVVKVIYSEDNLEPLVNVNDLVISIPVTVTVKKDDYFEIDKFIPAGYVTNPNRGQYRINLKYYALFSNGIMEDVTSRVKPITDVDPENFGVVQDCRVEITLDRLGLVKQTYNFSVYCTDPSITGNNSRVIINGTKASRILFYDGTKFSLGAFNSLEQQVKSDLESLLTSEALYNRGKRPTHIRVREVENSTKVFTNTVDNENDLVYIDTLKIPMCISPCKDIIFGDIINAISDNSIKRISEYGKNGRGLFEYYSATKPGVGSYDNYSFQYFSIDGGKTAISSDDRNFICKANKLITFDVDGEKVYPMEVHTKNSSIYSVAKDKPFLVEGYYKDENGRYVCTGGIIHYAETQS